MKRALHISQTSDIRAVESMRRGAGSDTYRPPIGLKNSDIVSFMADAKHYLSGLIPDLTIQRYDHSAGHEHACSRDSWSALDRDISEIHGGDGNAFVALLLRANEMLEIGQMTVVPSGKGVRFVVRESCPPALAAEYEAAGIVWGTWDAEQVAAWLSELSFVANMGCVHWGFFTAMVELDEPDMQSVFGEWLSLREGLSKEYLSLRAPSRYLDILNNLREMPDDE